MGTMMQVKQNMEIFKELLKENLSMSSRVLFNIKDYLPKSGC